MRIKKQTFIFLLATTFLLALVAVWPALAGSTASPGAPGSTSSYTLQDIYDRLTNGEAGTQSTFTQPIGAPGSTMADLNTIMDAVPALDDTNGAVEADVVSGKTIWGLTTSGWSVITGTKLAPLAQFIVPPPVVPATGQTGCWDVYGGVINSCDGTGQDGEYQLGITPAVEPTSGTEGAYNTPAWTGTRFTDNGDGTVTDNLTALIWLKNANCFGIRNWTAALVDANELADVDGTSNDCGLTDGSTAGDWRLPNINELHSLIDLTVLNPALPSGHPFSAVQSYFYWSSTSHASNTSSVWYVNLYNGVVNIDSKSFGVYVWPVRAGQ